MSVSAGGGGGGDVDLSRSPRQPDKSLGELFAGFTTDLSRLMRQEVALARTEVKEEVGRAGKAAGMLAAAGLVAYLALLIGSLAMAWALDDALPRPLAFFLVALLHGIIAAVLIVQGRKRLRQVSPVPQQTVDTLKEDVQWAKAQRS